MWTSQNACGILFSYMSNNFSIQVIFFTPMWNNSVAGVCEFLLYKWTYLHTCAVNILVLHAKFFTDVKQLCNARDFFFHTCGIHEGVHKSAWLAKYTPAFWTIRPQNSTRLQFQLVIDYEFGTVCLILLTIKVNRQRNKIPWEDHALLQMISEYFTACNRLLNFVKKPSFILELEHPTHEPPS